MTTVTKFLFDTSFDEIPLLPPNEETSVDEAEAEEIEEEEVVPTFSEAEVNAARDEGFSRGKNEGIRESSGAIERQISDTLATVDERLTQLIADQERSNVASAGDAVTVAVTIVRKIFPHLNRRHALDEVERLIEQSMEKIVNEPRVTIHVGAALHDTLDQRLSTIASKAGFEGRVALRADTSILDGDCLIEWTEGGAERDTTSMWHEIDEIIERNLGASVPIADTTGSIDKAGPGVEDTKALGPDDTVNSEPETLTVEEVNIQAPSSGDGAAAPRTSDPTEGV